MEPALQVSAGIVLFRFLRQRRSSPEALQRYDHANALRFFPMRQNSLYEFSMAFLGDGNGLLRFVWTKVARAA
jgi:hypothetical protein